GPDNAVALETPDQLAEQERVAVCSSDQRLQGGGRDVLERKQELARQLPGGLGRERAELQAQVIAAPFTPARLHLRQRRPRGHAYPERDFGFGHCGVLERFQRRVVGVVSVVEDHRQGTLLCT